jgi:predicted component of type VI protein secretion system
MFDLVVQSGKLEGKRLLLPLEKDIVIGREEGCQIVLPSTLISRQHCRLRRTELGLLVEDLGSQNGTFVNDVAIEGETLLVVGDTLRVGAILFEVQTHLVAPVPAKASTAPAPMPAKSDSVVRTLKKVPAAEKPSGISDHEIAAWLSDHDTATVSSISDTTIIRAERPVAPPPPPTPLPPTLAAAKIIAPAAAAAPPKPKPRTVKEEAADIIRRHWVKVRGESPEE